VSGEFAVGLVGIGGTLLGSVVTLWIEWVRRGWERKDKARDERSKYAEELAAIAAQMYEWQAKCFSDALEGKLEIPPTNMFRMGLLVTGYLPNAEKSSLLLTKAVEELYSACSEMAMEVKRRNAPGPLDDALVARVREAMNAVAGACIEMTKSASETLRIGRE
jgi:hypothetical protein